MRLVLSSHRELTPLRSGDSLQHARRAYTASRDWIRRHRWLAVALILAGVALNVFGELADELLEGTLLPVDHLILDVLRPWRTEPMHQVALALSELVRLPWVLLVAAPFLLYLVITGRRIILAALVFVPVGTLLIVELAKVIFQRNRPVTAIVAEFGYSFPSGHATGATVFYGLLGYVAWRFMTTARWARVLIAVVTVLMILGTGLARVYLEVHYPTDVLAGWAAGAFILSGTLIAVETWPRDESPVED